MTALDVAQQSVDDAVGRAIAWVSKASQWTVVRFLAQTSRGGAFAQGNDARISIQRGGAPVLSPVARAALIRAHERAVDESRGAA